MAGLEPQAGSGKTRGVGTAAAREVMLLREIETRWPPSPNWSAADRAWASRAAAEVSTPAHDLQAFVVGRARHAWQRLGPREPEFAAALQASATPGRWRSMVLPLALLGALLMGLGMDAFGNATHINLLAAPLWGVIAWNLAVYAGLGWRALHAAWPGAPAPRPALATPLRRWLARWGAAAGPAPHTGQAGHERAAVLQAFDAAWLPLRLPGAMAQAAVALHALAAALALGLVCGMYLRGLVLDIRAGWQSTFLDAASVHALLANVLAPASTLTGIAVPDLANLGAIRLGGSMASAPGAPLAAASGAPWIHLLAATLALFVMLPRSLLALASAWRARQLERQVRLPLHEAYFQRLGRVQRLEPALVQVLAHAHAASAEAAALLQRVFAEVLGEAVRLHFTTPVPHGEEDGADLGALLPAGTTPAGTTHAGTTHAVVLFDMTATPEPEHQIRLAERLAAAALARGITALWVVDEGEFERRFAATPQRGAERRAAWQAAAAPLRMPLLFVNTSRAMDAAAQAGMAAEWTAALEQAVPAAS